MTTATNLTPAPSTGPAGPRPTVGWIGLGAMGGPMATCLATAGLPVTAFDIDPAKAPALQTYGITSAATIADAARGADVLALMVATAGQAESVLFGEGQAAAALAPGAVGLRCRVGRWLHDHDHRPVRRGVRHRRGGHRRGGPVRSGRDRLGFGRHRLQLTRTRLARPGVDRPPAGAPRVRPRPQPASQGADPGRRTGNDNGPAQMCGAVVGESSC